MATLMLPSSKTRKSASLNETCVWSIFKSDFFSNLFEWYDLEIAWKNS